MITNRNFTLFFFVKFTDLPPNTKLPMIPDFPPRSLCDSPSGLMSAAQMARSIAAPGMGGGDGSNPTSGSLLDRPGPILDPLAFHKKLLAQKMSGSCSPGGLSAPAPSLYEMAALTHELDTQSVTTKVKEILLANNVGQKVIIKSISHFLVEIV